MDTVNEYGDQKTLLSPDHGIDIASQREDDLDRLALDRIRMLSRVSKPFALDVACGAGGQSLRMAIAGARVVAIDAAPLESIFKETLYKALEQADKDVLDAAFLRWDMRELPSSPLGSLEGRVDVIVCQRAIHYLPYDEALAAVTAMARCLTSDGRLYLSASGLGSELSENYAAKDDQLPKRFGLLSKAMLEKHGIRNPVCLYSLDDMKQLLQSAGLTQESIFESPFGNIKAIASKAK